MLRGWPVLLIIIVIVALTAVAVIHLFRKDAVKLGHLGMGMTGIVAAAAIFGGALLYYLEDRGRPKLDVSTEVNVAPLAPEPDGSPRVLLQFIGRITNLGSSSAGYDCVAIDAHGFRRTGVYRRAETFRFDLQPEPLLEETAGGAQWNRCLDIEQDRWDRRQRRQKARTGIPARAFVRTTTGYRYFHFDLAPGESRTRHFELIVPCHFAAVRFIFVVPQQATHSVQETKTLVPLDTACAISREMAAEEQAQSRTEQPPEPPPATAPAME